MKKVLYVPLDDRPVNLDDVIKQGETAGIRVLTPPAEDVKNRMDTRKTDSGSTLLTTHSPVFGKPIRIRKFILDHAADADGFIISADMLVYGGLIGSRRLRTSPVAAYPDYDSEATQLLDVIRQLKQMYPEKPVYVLDTIMRMAANTFVEGTSLDVYNETRSFAQQPRQSAADLAGVLTSYDVKPDGTKFPAAVAFDKTHYYQARQHKLQTNYYILEQLARAGYIDFLAIGVDDSYIQGIQANEIALAERCIDDWLGGAGGQNPERAILLPEADGLGHSLLARMADRFYRRGDKTGYAIRYYGPHGSTIINVYEYMNLHQNILRHIDIVGGRYEEESPDAEILVITAAGQAAGAVSQLEANGQGRIPTVVIDCIGFVADRTVTEALLASRYAGRLLGYSSWNTYGNRTGLALGMAHARYMYVRTESRPSSLDQAVNAHGSLLFKRFLKDYYYKVLAIAEVRAYSNEHSLYKDVTANQHMRLFNAPADYAYLVELLRERMQTHTSALAMTNAFGIGAGQPSSNVSRVDEEEWTYADYARASLAPHNPDFIWGRAFEITLAPKVKLDD
ncbi:DUF4127 family protein [Paenibacillus methanolicus]|uniref:Uncharacterized protein DUF4127 n=1 Tax=Paenibacillus methanolicus TaxID=582686 RepID=A0A5S5BY93_9BACL|nr:DUF4127 family protein [Paenibacillus methanolicus]TYP72007.1 uncharacterized protein DUF4127 [Paenibacillus methanolicus]